MPKKKQAKFQHPWVKKMVSIISFWNEALSKIFWPGERRSARSYPPQNDTKAFPKWVIKFSSCLKGGFSKTWAQVPFLFSSGLHGDQACPYFHFAFPASPLGGTEVFLLKLGYRKPAYANDALSNKKITTQNGISPNSDSPDLDTF